MVVYKFSDAWFLLATNYAQDNKERAHLDAIIDAGDYINHARFTDDEIAGAISRLKDGGYLVERDGGYAVTSLFLSRWTELRADEHQAIHRHLDVVNKILCMHNNTFAPLKTVNSSKKDTMTKHIGSTISLVLGTFLLFSIFSDPKVIDSSIALSGFHAGLLMILGALAYRSAKKRKLKSVKSTILRQSFEVASICIIIVSVIFQSNLMYRITTEPVTNAVIPLWAIIAYLIISFKAIKKKNIEE